MQTGADARMEAIESGQHVPNAFAGGDFILTEFQVQFLFAGNFLPEYIQKSQYREHLELNFDEKIFFHEPVNKFYDLPLVKKLALDAYKKVQHLQDPLSMSKKQID